MIYGPNCVVHLVLIRNMLRCPTPPRCTLWSQGWLLHILMSPHAARESGLTAYSRLMSCGWTTTPCLKAPPKTLQILSIPRKPFKPVPVQLCEPHTSIQILQIPRLLLHGLQQLLCQGLLRLRWPRCIPRNLQSQHFKGSSYLYNVELQI